MGKTRGGDFLQLLQKLCSLCQSFGIGRRIIINYSVLSDAVGYRLRRAQLAVFQDFGESFVAEGLRPADFSVVLLIKHNPGLKQSEVAEALGIQRANFVAIVDGLEGVIWSSGGSPKPTAASRRFISPRSANSSPRTC